MLCCMSRFGPLILGPLILRIALESNAFERLKVPETVTL